MSPASGITVLSIISFGLVLLKLGELFLRPHQKNWLQSKMEHLTLVLDTELPDYDSYIAKLPFVPAKYIYLAAISFVVGGTVIIEHSLTSAGVFSGLSCFLIAFFVSDAAARWQYAPEFLTGFGPKSLTLHGGLQALYCVFGALSLLLIIPFLGALIGRPATYVFLFVLLISGNKTLYIKITAIPYIMFVAALAFLLLLAGRPLLRFLVALSWRIVEHPGGAWPALILLLTTVLLTTQWIMANG